MRGSNFVASDLPVGHLSIAFSVKPSELPAAVLELELLENDVSVYKTSGVPRCTSLVHDDTWQGRRSR